MNAMASFQNVAASGTYTVSGAGRLERVVVNATAAGTITLYDNTEASGTKVATLVSSITEGSYEFGVDLKNGLTAVLAANSDVTFVYTQ